MKVGDSLFEVLILRPGRLPSFDAVLDLLGERSRRNELTVVGDDSSVYGAEDNLGPRGLVNSLGCAASTISLASLGVRDGFNLKVPRLVSSPQSIRYVCSFAANPKARDSVKESYPLRTEFTAFANLWTGYDGAKDFVSETGRRTDAMGLGQRMGEIHKIPLMWIDAHRSQFAWNLDKSGNVDFSRRMIVFDLFYDTGDGYLVIDDKASTWRLYRGPTPAQCATMLVPLLAYFENPSEYKGFCLGYLAERGQDGRRVLNYIEIGDRTGWRLALDSGDFALAAKRAKAQLDEDDSEDPDINLLSVIGLSYSNLGRYDEACATYKQAMAASPQKVILQFNLGQAHYRAGRLDQAAAEFRAVIQREEESLSSQQLLDAARTMLSRC